MMRSLFDSAEFAGGTVHWNKLDVDPEMPPRTQLHDFYDGLLWVTFPTGVGLDIGWFPDVAPEGEFEVSLVDLSKEEWHPFQQQRCRSFAELRAIVDDFVQIAKSRPSVPTHVLFAGLQVWFDELVLDQTRPPQEQTERLKERLYETSLSGDRMLRVGWEPPHDPAGEFVVRLVHYPERLEDMLEHRPPGGRLLQERRCRTIPELKAIVEELTRS